ncbi:hypothetical protein [uncultured Dialister sp.]|uniref:hypothetical protein n=1 Tax=uncultured Dialister sp. TaxID=278064 RepID=UPI002592A23C|nr:hypothetical protein [uncultured Dialister sp.]
MGWKERAENAEKIAGAIKDIPVSEEALLIARGFQVASEVLKAREAKGPKEIRKGESA